MAGAVQAGYHDGIYIENYQIKYQDTRYNSFDMIGFNSNNVLIIGHYTLAEIKKEGFRDAVSFGPGLIINGKPMITSGNGGWGIQPRTANGQKKDGTILLLVVDGRQATSIGASLRDLQDTLLEY